MACARVPTSVVCLLSALRVHDIGTAAPSVPSDASTIRALLEDICAMPCPEALSTSFAFDGPRVCQAVTACFERHATPWTADAPAVLTPAFYQRAEPAARWSHYLASGAVLVPPPASFDVIGEAIMRFLGPVRDRIVAGEPFADMWPAGGPWSSAIRTERVASGRR